MSFDGNTLSFEHKYTGVGVTWGGTEPYNIRVNGSTKTSGLLSKSGIEVYSLTVDDTSIGFDFHGSAMWSNGFYDSSTRKFNRADINGAVFEDVNGTIAPIIGVTFKTNIKNFMANDVFFTSEKISIDLQGLTTLDNSYLWLKVVFRPVTTNIVYRAGEDSAFVRGQHGNDQLFGGDGDDVFQGDKGADLLNGGKGDDILYGGEGRDRLYGGEGTDTFVFRSVKDFGKTTTTTDTIFDFTKDDRIDLSAIDADTKTRNDQSFTFIDTKMFSGKAGELRFVKDKADTYVYGDVNGDKSADFVLHLDVAITLTEGMFVL
jgi:Ca2+-binding RTX toxin-like protein